MKFVPLGGEGDDTDLSAAAEGAKIAAVPFDVESAGVADDEAGVGAGGEGLALIGLEHAAEDGLAIGGNGEPGRFLRGKIERKSGSPGLGSGRGYWNGEDWSGTGGRRGRSNMRRG